MRLSGTDEDDGYAIVLAVVSTCITKSERDLAFGIHEQTDFVEL